MYFNFCIKANHTNEAKDVTLNNCTIMMIHVHGPILILIKYFFMQWLIYVQITLRYKLGFKVPFQGQK